MVTSWYSTHYCKTILGLPSSSEAVNSDVVDNITLQIYLYLLYSLFFAYSCTSIVCCLRITCTHPHSVYVILPYII